MLSCGLTACVCSSDPVTLCNIERACPPVGDRSAINAAISAGVRNDGDCTTQADHLTAACTSAVADRRKLELLAHRLFSGVEIELHQVNDFLFATRVEQFSAIQ